MFRTVHHARVSPAVDVAVVSTQRSVVGVDKKVPVSTRAFWEKKEHSFVQNMEA